MFDGAIDEFALGEISAPVVGGTIGGYVSYTAFWLGGASAIISIVPPIPPSVAFGGGMAIPLRRKKKPIDDEEALILISQQLAQIFWKKDD